MTDTDRTPQDPRIEGARASARQDSHKTNPHQKGSAEAQAWLDGYLAETEAMTKGKTTLPKAPPAEKVEPETLRDEPPPTRKPDAPKVDRVDPASAPPAVQAFGQKRSETAATAQAARSFAMVQARFAMAERKPRSWQAVGAKLLAECARYDFAGRARYEVENRGSGLSIGFAELALQLMGNADASKVIVAKDDPADPRSGDHGGVVLEVTVIDFETNASWSDQVKIPRTIERKSPKGREVVSQRENSWGETTYRVVATDDEMRGQINNFGSRSVREGILHFVPRDLQDECELVVVETIQKGAGKDPAGDARRVLAGFVRLGVPTDEVVEWLGKPLEQAGPHDVVRLKGIWTRVNEGKDWAEIIAAVRRERAPADEEAAVPSGGKTGSKAEQARDRAKGAGA